jgi:hypothetical protein
MKKITTLGFLLALAISASAQSNTTVRPDAHGKVSGNATNSTVNVPPVAKAGPVAVRGGKK